MLDLNDQYLAEAKSQFDADGFLKVPAVLTAEDKQAIDAELERYVRDIGPTLPATDIVWEAEPMPDGSRRIRNLWRLEKYSPLFASIGLRPDLLKLAGTLVNGEPVVMGVELFAKPGRVGSVVPFHQDNAYFTLTPPDCFTLWIALDASSVENGCVYYARGSHKGPALPHKPSGVLGNSMMAAEVPDGLEEVPGVLEAGDAMLHHCMTIHRSEPNRSDRSRRGLLIVYRGAHAEKDPEAARYYNQVRDELQASVA